jgi:hypothetical protein
LVEPPELLELEDVPLADAVALADVLLAVALLDLLAAEVLAAVLAFCAAAISASTRAISEATNCAAVALALLFEASSLTNSFSREAIPAGRAWRV